MNETVKYHNDLNSVSMRTWTADEMNMFFTIIAKIKNEGVREITLSTDEIKNLIKFKPRHKDRWEKVMIGVSEKIADLKYRYEDKQFYRVMNLFTFFEIDKDNKTLRVAVSEQFEYILNQLDIQFTYYKLEEFVDIKSTYAKTAYRLFKQWKTTGKIKFEIDEFKRKLDIPNSYGISNIDNRVIKPIMSELPTYFENLNVKKVKANSRGTPVIGYEFTWKPETTGLWTDFDSNTYTKEPIEPVPMINWLEDLKNK